MKKLFALSVFFISVFSISSCLAARNLDIYFIDVVGGAATVIVTPAGETVLIDTGWMRDDHRDAKRIHDTIVNRAGLSQIDHLIITHWHRDHYGDIEALNEMVPIKNFYDKGIPETFPEDQKNFDIQIAQYKKASQGETTTLKAGAFVPLKQMPGTPNVELLCVAANREVITSEEQTNPLCKKLKTRKYDPSDNANSIALLLRYGAFKFFNGGDITWNVEGKLVCPTNKVGKVDLYMVNHHGFDISNNPIFLQSLHPKVAVMCNGPTKGCSPKTIERLRSLPELKAIYQLHRNTKASDTQNTDPQYIANPNPEHSGQYVKTSVAVDGKSYITTIGEENIPTKLDAYGQ